MPPGQPAGEAEQVEDSQRKAADWGWWQAEEEEVVVVGLWGLPAGHIDLGKATLPLAL